MGSTPLPKWVGDKINKDKVLKDKVEREDRAMRSPPDPLIFCTTEFEPYEKTNETASSGGLTTEEMTSEFKKFLIRNEGKKNKAYEWQRLFHLWIERAVQYKKEHPVKKQVAVNEIRSTVPYAKPPQFNGTKTPMPSKIKQLTKSVLSMDASSVYEEARLLREREAAEWLDKIHRKELPTFEDKRLQNGKLTNKDRWTS
jgi:hypothetical protein